MTDPLTLLAVACLICAAVPAVVFVRNLSQYRPPDMATTREAVSVLIPARNEEASIAACVESALASRGVDLEVIVLDDRSGDATATIVRGIAARDPRVRLETAPPLPPGWCGKQYACAALGRLATCDWFVFLDADVRLSPDSLARTAAHAERRRIDLLSGVPTEETGTLAEKLVIPLIHFVLLGFLSLRASRAFRGPAWAAGCGQFFLTTRAAYDRAGGHAAIRGSLHDGLMLPRAYRRAGLTTDVIDLSGLARCRMYRSAAEVWRGLAKNATEGLAAPALIGPATALLLFGQVLPVVVFAVACLADNSAAVPVAVVATAASYLPRLIAARRFRQSRLGAALHPLGVLGFLASQWTAFACRLAGRPATWKGRSYVAGAASARGNTRPFATLPRT